MYAQIIKNVDKHKLTSFINVYMADFDNLPVEILNKKYNKILFLESVGYSRDFSKLMV